MMNIIYVLFVFFVNYLIFLLVNYDRKDKIFTIIILFSLSIFFHLIQLSFIQLMTMEEFFNLIFPSIALLIIYYAGGTLENRFEKRNINNPELTQLTVKVSRFVRNKLLVFMTTILQILIIFIPELRH